VVARQDRLDQPERGEGDYLADNQHRRGEHGRLGGQHRAAARRRGERDADQAGAVLGGERQHAHHADRDHRVFQADDLGQQRVG
jgi:hypothetical protein